MILIFLFIAGTIFPAFTQDIIYRTSGTEIKCKVEEVSESAVKYHLYDNLLGPLHSISGKSIFMIKFENGDKDVFEYDKATGEVTIKHKEAVVEETAETRKTSQKGVGISGEAPVRYVGSQIVSSPKEEQGKDTPNRASTETNRVSTHRASTETKPVEIFFTPDKTVYFIYYNRDKAQWTDISAKTSKNGSVTFKVPLDDEGNTYPFIYTSQAATIAEAKDARKGTVRCVRVVGERLAVQLYENGGGMIKEGSLQIAINE
jgi:hypothetical protein